MCSRCLKLYRPYSISCYSPDVGEFFLSSILKGCIKVQEKKEGRCLVFTSSTKREIKQFHVVVVQRRQRNEQKDVIHVQRCCFANLTLLPFCRPRCRRRRCCLSFLIIRTERFWFNISRRKVFFFPRSQRFLISIFVVVVVIVLFLLVM